MTTYDTAYHPEPDLGTPPVSPRADLPLVTLTIDGQEVTVPEGTSVLRAARELGIDIPTACATDSLAAFGSCRLCLVEVEGGKGVPASCTTPCADGAVVQTRTEQVQRLRRGVMELYLSDHPADCAGCARGNCEIADLARRTGVVESRFLADRAPTPAEAEGSRRSAEFSAQVFCVPVGPIGPGRCSSRPTAAADRQ